MKDRWPDDDDWRAVSPDALGLDPEGIAAAAAHAQRHETKMGRDLAAELENGLFGEPWPIRRVIGPVKDRGGPAG